MKFQPLEKDIAQLQEAMDEGTLTSAELTHFYLDRISAYDKSGPKLNAIVSISDSALADAAKLDAERKTTGKRSALHGIPVVVKDNFNTFDMPTTASSVLLAENRPSADAFLVGKLRAAGAVILAKTNLSEFACHGLTDSTLLGQTLNPYDLTRTPGGSSGGTGSAVAACFAAAGLGSDTANSARSPASATNLVGFRPTTGLFSRTGIIPVSSTQDSAGTLTRSVYDAAVLFDICAGFDGSDPESAQQVGQVPLSYQAYLKEDGLQGKRLGLLSNNFKCDPEVGEIMESAVRLMSENGAEIIPVDVPELESSRIQDTCDVQYYECQKLLNMYLKQTSTLPAMDLRSLLDSGKLHPLTANFMEKCVEADRPERIEDYKDRLLARHRNRNLAYYVMAEHKLDAFFYPHQKILVQHVGLQTQNGRNGIVASILGFPAVTVPAGFSHPTADAQTGVPVGIEFMARSWAEPVLFEVAYAFEQLSHSRKLPFTTP